MNLETLNPNPYKKALMDSIIDPDLPNSRISLNHNVMHGIRPH